jgi:hypothetical protein
MAQTWTNADSLTLKFGVAKTEAGLAGHYRHDGAKNLIEINLDYTRMPAVASNSVVIDRAIVLPIGSIVESVEIINSSAFTSSGSSMTLNVGWVDLDETSNIDVDAFVIAATQTELNDGGTNVAGWVGAEVLGAPTTTAKYLTYEVDSQAATAGAGVVRLYYSTH